MRIGCKTLREGEIRSRWQREWIRHGRELRSLKRYPAVPRDILQKVPGAALDYVARDKLFGYQKEYIAGKIK